ncbi:3D domain-containing protein [Bdellovibrio sp. HCB2-146]|uniref:3D domain-containing protein n=1 Tax=Bdellovibrio sp. HCB2-146 TaxID=3394362 RepID=UPI0039BC65C8
MISRFTVLGTLFAIANVAHSQMCASNVAQTSTYFIPNVRDYCKSSTPCSKFRKQVRMQGSGTLPGNRILTYNGKIKSLGSCETAFGASGKCLIPYISIAADPRYYRMGDIIQMPSMKGRVVTLPNGKIMVHPGFFIVQDTGGAIKGINRFDFFTGSHNMYTKNNAFGTKALPDMQMVDKGNCSDHKFFSVVPRLSNNYETSLAMIEDALRGAVSTRNIASRNSTRGTK